MGIWQSILSAFEAALRALHGVFEPLFAEAAWGWAIIALTVIVRLALTPLAIKQFTSMRKMQSVQPKVTALKKKYNVDRELMRKDPERYRAQKAKLNTEMMALYKEEGVNPAAGCLPLLLQAPVFFALFSVLRDLDDLRNAPFYFVTAPISGQPSGLGASASAAGWAGWLLILLMAATMFWTQRQMMARNQATSDGGPAAQQQKIMLYVMPVFLAAISFQFPLGVLLYWVTTNVWQLGQQALILREVRAEVEERVDRASPDGRAGTTDAKRAPGARGAKRHDDRTGTADADERRRRRPRSGGGRGAGDRSGRSRPRRSDDERRDPPARRPDRTGPPVQPPSTNGSDRPRSDRGSHLPKRRKRS